MKKLFTIITICPQLLMALVCGVLAFATRHVELLALRPLQGDAQTGVQTGSAHGALALLQRLGGFLHVAVGESLSLADVLLLACIAFTLCTIFYDIVSSLREGEGGVDLLAFVALLSTAAVGELWASWLVCCMVYSGALIEEYAQNRAERELTQLIDGSPHEAHVMVVPVEGSSVISQLTVGQFAAEPSAQSALSHEPRVFTDEQGEQVRPLKVEEILAPSNLGLSGAATAPGSAESQSDRLPDDQPDDQLVLPAQSHSMLIDAEQVEIGDVVVVLPGETVPVDGKLVDGIATLDLSNLTGEPLPQEHYFGASIPSGAINGSKAFTMQVVHQANNSQYQHIIQLVASAKRSKPRAARLADALSVPFTIISFMIAGLAWAVSGNPVRFVQVLVLATPCPLLIAVPVAFMAGAARLARHGIIVKSQNVITDLSQVRHAFFDKTGTLTLKRPQVVRVDMIETQCSLDPAITNLITQRPNVDYLLMTAGVVEGYSLHILANGVKAAGLEARNRVRSQVEHPSQEHPTVQQKNWANQEYPRVRDVVEDSGNGVEGIVEDVCVRVGRLAYVCAGRQQVAQAVRQYLSEAAEPLAADEMAAYVALDGIPMARIVLKDIPRANAAAVVAELKAMGVAHTVMLTGDHRQSAQVIARAVGIDEFHAELLPEQKVQLVERYAKKMRHGVGGSGGQPRATKPSALANLREHLAFWRLLERDEGTIMMVGDGVNDAPVLAAADIGVAIGDGASNAASQSAPMVVMNDDLSTVAQGVRIARRTRRILLQAIAMGLGLAIVGMITAAFGLIPAVVGAFLQEVIDVVAIMWALTALFDPRRQVDPRHPVDLSRQADQPHQVDSRHQSHTTDPSTT